MEEKRRKLHPAYQKSGRQGESQAPYCIHLSKPFRSTGVPREDGLLVDLEFRVCLNCISMIHCVLSHLLLKTHRKRRSKTRNLISCLPMSFEKDARREGMRNQENTIEIHPVCVCVSVVFDLVLLLQLAYLSLQEVDGLSAGLQSILQVCDLLTGLLLRCFQLLPRPQLQLRNYRHRKGQSPVILSTQHCCGVTEQ